MSDTNVNSQNSLEAELEREARRQQPSNLESWNPRKFYEFVDLGCGEDAVRLHAVAKEHPEWYLLGIDPVFERTKSYYKMDLVKAKAHEALSRLRDRSLRFANSDYFFEYDENIHPYDVLELLVEKLAPDRKLFVSHNLLNGPKIRKLVATCGFEPTPSLPIDESELLLTPYGQFEQELMDRLKRFARGEDVYLPRDFRVPGRSHLFSRNPYAYQPMRFEATLR